MKKLGLIFVVVISLVFTVSCISKEVPVTETYYETESKTESYIDIVNGEDELTPEINWYCENLVISAQPSESAGVRSFSGVWYLGYKLPEHSSSKVIIQTWDREVKSPSNPPSLYNSPPLSLLEQQNPKNEMVSAYDMSNTGHLTKPPFDKPVYVIYHYIGPSGYTLPPQLNVYPFEEKQFNEWLDYFNVQLTKSSLGTQYSCDNPSSSYCFGDIKSEYQFDTTGVKTVAIIIAGREYRGPLHGDLSGNMGYVFTPPESSGDPWPVKSIKLTWSDKVNKQRDIPYQAEKQRTVMQTKKVPFWEALFSK